ncbi:MAG: pro-sigmaK processing inhibitor BofA family protein, partial [Halobacteriota archaeon]
ARTSGTALCLDPTLPSSKRCFQSNSSSFFSQKAAIANYFSRTTQIDLMDVTTAIGLLVVAILVLIVLYILVKIGARYGRYLAVNSILGIIVLALANFFGLPVPINLITIIICAFAGIPGALLVILLFVLGIVA